MPMDNTVAGYVAPNALAAVILIGASQVKSTPIRKAAKRSRLLIVFSNSKKITQ